MIESKRGKKTSSEKIVEVLTAKVENPDLSLRDIAKKTGVNYKTSGDIINKELDEVVTSCNKKKKSLMDRNLTIIELGKEIIEQNIREIGNGTGEVKINSVSDIRTLSATLEDSFKQNQLLEGKPTENVNVLSEVLKEIQGLKDNKL